MAALCGTVWNTANSDADCLGDPRLQQSLMKQSERHQTTVKRPSVWQGSNGASDERQWEGVPD